MKVKDIMTPNPIVVGMDTKISEIANIIFKNRFHAVPVVEKERVVGIITEGDFFTKDSSFLFLPSYIDFISNTQIAGALTKDKQEKINKLLNISAKDIMTKECVSILEDMEIEDLLNFFRETKYTTLPVIDSFDKLVGIITLVDILGLIKV
jgi:acetoin utilization protein AcuB